MAADSLIADKPTPQAADRPERLSWITHVKYMFVRGFLWGWALCFSLKGLYLFGQFFGLCEYLVNYKRRRRFRQHLARVFGEAFNPADRRFIRHATLRHFMRTRSDKLLYLIFDKLPKEKILKRVKWHQREILDEAVARGKGAYVCLSHVGSHHVVGLLMALMGYRAAGVRDRNEGTLRRYVQRKYEESFPEIKAIRIFYADTFPRDIYRAFQEGLILGSALDIGRDRGSHLRTATVSMFGQPREFLTGTLQIALRCGAPILQGFVVSKKNFYFHLHVLGPLADPNEVNDTPESLQAIMQRYADNIAAHVREHPCHISKT